MIREIWNKLNWTIAVPLGLGFILLAVVGQMCFDNLPYLMC